MLDITNVVSKDLPNFTSFEKQTILKISRFELFVILQFYIRVLDFKNFMYFHFTIFLLNYT